MRMRPELKRAWKPLCNGTGQTAKYVIARNAWQVRRLNPRRRGLQMPDLAKQAAQ